MPRIRSSDSIKAERLYHQGMSLVEIAEKLNKPSGTIRRWKSTQSWDKNKSERSVLNANARKQKAIVKEVEKTVENAEGLTDKQRLFCCHYIRCFNATKAYQKTYQVSYEVAAAAGSRLLKKEKIQETIRKLKQNRLNREMLTEDDIFQKYMDIAFCDMADYVSFGRETVPVMGAFGPVKMEDPKTGEKTTLTKEINVVRFRESNEVDGTLISEVKQGKDGASVKLMDRMKALNWLSEHMDMATDEQKARIEQIKAKTEQIRGADQNPLEDKVRKLFEAIGGALDESG